MCAGTVTITDNNGRGIVATLAPGQNMFVIPSWTRPSTSVKVASAAKSRMGITALTYR